MMQRSLITRAVVLCALAMQVAACGLLPGRHASQAALPRAYGPDPGTEQPRVRTSRGTASLVRPQVALAESAAARRRWAREPTTDYATLVWKPMPLMSAEAAAAERRDPSRTAGIGPRRLAEPGFADAPSPARAVE